MLAPASALSAAGMSLALSSSTRAKCAPGNEVLEGRGDLYGGMAVPAKEIDACESVENFAERLGKSIDHWTSAEKRGIWLEIPSHRPELITVAVGNKFEVKSLSLNFSRKYSTYTGTKRHRCKCDKRTTLKHIYPPLSTPLHL
jgi:hypothetical protein